MDKSVENIHFKEPSLLSYFPLVLYPGKYTQIPSIPIRKQMFLFHHNYKVTHESFEPLYYSPSSLLIHSHFNSWKTNRIYLPRGLPYYSHSFKVTFDILTSIPEQIQEEFQDTIRILEIQHDLDIDFIFYLDAKLNIKYGRILHLSDDVLYYLSLQVSQVQNSIYLELYRHYYDNVMGFHSNYLPIL